VRAEECARNVTCEPVGTALSEGNIGRCHILYLMMPLNKHYDDGFGATAEAFLSAALTIREKQKSPLLLELLPQNYLLRHSIELFLKSGILIIHRKLKIPFDDKPHNSQPMVHIGDKWEPFFRVHSIADLYTHWKSLITPNAETLTRMCKYTPNWTIAPEVDGWIAFIEKTDPNSTYYRYPASRDQNEDKNKSSFKEIATQDLFPEGLIPHFLFELCVSGCTIAPTPVFMRF